MQNSWYDSGLIYRQNVSPALSLRTITLSTSSNKTNKKINNSKHPSNCTAITHNSGVVEVKISLIFSVEEFNFNNFQTFKDWLTVSYEVDNRWLLKPSNCIIITYFLNNHVQQWISWHYQQLSRDLFLSDCLLIWFSNIYLLQIKVCNVVTHHLVWFSHSFIEDVLNN